MVRDERSEKALEDEGPDDADVAELGEKGDSETVPCPSCGAQIYEDADRCPKCGKYVTIGEPRRGVLWKIVALIVVLGLIAALVAFVMAQ